MKKIWKIMATLAVVSLCSIACQKETQKEDSGSDDSEKKDEPVTPTKNTEASLKSLVAIINGEEVTGTIYKNDKVVEFVYLPEEISYYQAAQLKATVSDGATTNITDGQTYDLVSHYSLTITSEDGNTTNTFSVEAVPANTSVSCDELWTKTAAAANLAYTRNDGPCVAFAGTDKLVYVTGQVVNLADASAVGTLCMDGCISTSLRSITNDVNGILIGSCMKTNIDGNIVEHAVYAWLDGYDKAPTTMIYNDWSSEPKSVSGYRFMSVGGDVNGEFNFMAITDGRSETTMHHLYHYSNGDFSNPTWYAFNTQYVSNDGCWSQMVSPASGDIDGMFFIGDSNGANAGYSVYARQGIEEGVDDAVLFGTVWCDGLADRPAEGNPLNHEYGNFSYGYCKGFMFNGTAYVATASTGWPCTYLTIQDANPVDLDEDEARTEEDDAHYLLRSVIFDASPQASPSVAYIYNPSEDKGYVALVSGEYSAGGAYFVSVYQISRVIY